MHQLRLLSSFCFVLFACIFSHSATAESSLTLLHFNDVYEVSALSGKGGLANLATLLKNERAKKPEALTTFGGDLMPAFLSGIPLTSGEMFTLLKSLKIDLAVFGNHEFDEGAETLLLQSKFSDIPWLAGNVTRHDGSFYALKSTIKTVDALRVGFLSLVLKETESISNPGTKVQFEEIIRSAASQIQWLQSRGAQVVIALTHLPIDQDRKLLEHCPEIDLILGGHDHDLTVERVGQKLIYKSGMNFEHLGVVTVHVKAGHKNVDFKVLPVLDVEPDKSMVQEIDRLEKVHVAANHKKLCTLGIDINEAGKVHRTRETIWGMLAADALRDRFKADLGLINGGNIRGATTFLKGSVLTLADVLCHFPFFNQALVVRVRGRDFKRMLEIGLSRVHEKGGGFPHVSGVTVQYDLARPKGDRVVTLLHKGAPLELEKLYVLATIDYLHNGGDGYEPAFACAEKIPHPPTWIRNVVADYLKIKGIMRSAPPSRISAARGR